MSLLIGFLSSIHYPSIFPASHPVPFCWLQCSPKRPIAEGINPTHQPRPSLGKAEFPNDRQLQHQGHLVTHQSDSKKKNANSNSLGQCRALSLAVSQIAMLGRERQTPRELMFSHFMQCCLGYNGNKKYFF